MAGARGESLEDRTLLTTFVVTNPTDDPFSPGTLRAAVVQANNNPGADDIVIDPAAIAANASLSVSGDLIVTDDLTINLGGRTLETSVNDRLVTATGSGTSLTIEDAVLIGTDTTPVFGNGGVIFSGFEVTLRNTVVRDGNAANNGGGIWAATGVFVDAGSVVQDSTAVVGGGIYAPVVAIENSAVTGNSAGVGGGIRATASLRLTDALLADNTSNAGSGGGAFVGIIGTPGTTTVEGSVVRDNTAGTANFASGGGLYLLNSNTTIEQSRLTGNTAENEGGGVFHQNNTLAVSDTIIADNTAGENGGGISAPMASTISLDGVRFGLAGDGSTLPFNEAIRGGDIYAAMSTLELDRVASLGSRAGAGGFAYLTETPTTGTTLNIRSPRASSNGGGFWLDGDSPLQLENSVVRFASAINGGAIYSAGSAIELDGSQLSDATTTGDGGAVWTTAPLVMNRSVSEGNLVNGSGGSIYLSGSAASLSAAFSAFDGNEAGNRGGVVATGGVGSGGGGLVNFARSILRNNVAADGGAIAVNGSVARLVGSVALGNEANNGGVFYAENDSHVVVLQGSGLVGNASTLRGGAIRTVDSRIDINNSVVRQNEAVSGGAISHNGGPTTERTLNLRNVSATSNTATNSGGFAFVEGMARVNVLVGSFVSNSAGGNGGALWLADGVTLFSKFASAFINNVATDGGAIYSAGGSVAITDGVFRGNTASDQGAALYRADGAVQVQLIDTVFNKNVAAAKGGAVYTEDRVVSTRSLYQTNRGSAGAGIFAAAGAIVELTDDTFQFNVAGDTDGPGTFV